MSDLPGTGYSMMRPVFGGMVSMYLDQVAAIDPSAVPATGTEADYAKRNECIWWAFAFAHGAGFRCGVGLDPNEPGYVVVYIELPTGQVSWHVPVHDRPWDGHTTEQKYRRIEAFSVWHDGPAPETAYPPCGQKYPCEHAPDGGPHPVWGTP